MNCSLITKYVVFLLSKDFEKEIVNRIFINFRYFVNNEIRLKLPQLCWKDPFTFNTFERNEFYFPWTGNTQKTNILICF